MYCILFRHFPPASGELFAVELQVAMKQQKEFDKILEREYDLLRFDFLSKIKYETGASLCIKHESSDDRES